MKILSAKDVYTGSKPRSSQKTSKPRSKGGTNMAKGKSSGKKDHINTFLILGGLGALYLLTSKTSEATPPGPGGSETIYKEKETIYQPGKDTQTYLERIINSTIVNPAAQIVSGVAEIPGQVVIGIPKKMITDSEQRTSTEVFGDVRRENVSAFWATAPPGSSFKKAINYQEFIQEQPLLFRAAAGTGNIITGQEAARYGSYAAEETKKGFIAAGRDPVQYSQRFTELTPTAQTFVGLGQAITVPFGGGGATGWGASFGKWLFGR